MTWNDILLIILTGIDCAALAVGLTVLRRVTRLVKATGDQIHLAVMESIDQAKHDTVDAVVAELGPAVGTLLSQLSIAVQKLTNSVN